MVVEQMKINAEPGLAIIPMTAQSCKECVLYSGGSCAVPRSDRDCSDFEGQFGGYVFKVIQLDTSDLQE
jgi:hypothetical protein